MKPETLIALYVEKRMLDRWIAEIDKHREEVRERWYKVKDFPEFVLLERLIDDYKMDPLTAAKHALEFTKKKDQA